MVDKNFNLRNDTSRIKRNLLFLFFFTDCKKILVYLLSNTFFKKLKKWPVFRIDCNVLEKFAFLETSLPKTCGVGTENKESQIEYHFFSKW